MANAVEVRGTGPAGVPIFIADITFMGEPLGTGTIGPDGKVYGVRQAVAGWSSHWPGAGCVDGHSVETRRFLSAGVLWPGRDAIPPSGFLS